MSPEWHPLHTSGFRWTRGKVEGLQTQHWVPGISHQLSGTSHRTPSHIGLALAQRISSSLHARAILRRVRLAFLERRSLAPGVQTTGGQLGMIPNSDACSTDFDSLAEMSDAETLTTTVTGPTLRRAGVPTAPLPPFSSPLAHRSSSVLRCNSWPTSVPTTWQSLLVQGPLFARILHRLVGMGSCPTRRRVLLVGVGPAWRSEHLER